MPTRCTICGLPVLSGNAECDRCSRAALSPLLRQRRQRRTGPVRDFVDGIFAFFTGLCFLGARRRLWPYALIPILINVVLMLALLGVAVYVAGGWGVRHADTWWQTILAWLAFIVVTAATLAAILVVFTVVGTAIAAPFNGPLSEKVEDELIGLPFEEKRGTGAALREIVRATRATLALTVIQVAVLLGMAVLLLVPAVGGAPLFVTGVFFAAMDFLDVVMDRKRYSTRAKFGFMRDHLAQCLGFGLAAYVALLVPLLNLLILPVAATGATILFLGCPKAGTAPRDAEQGGRVPQR